MTMKYKTTLVALPIVEDHHNLGDQDVLDNIYNTFFPNKLVNHSLEDYRFIHQKKIKIIYKDFNGSYQITGEYSKEIDLPSQDFEKEIEELEKQIVCFKEKIKELERENKNLFDKDTLFSAIAAVNGHSLTKF